MHQPGSAGAAGASRAGQDETVNAGQWPAEVAHLPVCPHRNLPIPFIAEVGADGTGHFTILDDHRKRECLEQRLCAMCGLRMDAEVAFLGDVASLDPDAYWIEPPVHERCAEIAAAGLCPYVSRERVPRRPPEDNVALLGMTPDHLADVGQSIPKRPYVMAVAQSYSPALALAHDNSVIMVYQAWEVVRVRRYAWDSNGLLAEVLPASSQPPRAARNQPRRRTRSQRQGRFTGGGGAAHRQPGMGRR
jgi:hypothetical protein